VTTTVAPPAGATTGAAVHGPDPAVAPFADRISGLRAVRDLLADDPADVIRLLTEISTHRAASYEIQAAVETLDGAADEINRHRPGLVEDVAVFMPSNVILYSYVLYLLVPGLFSRRLVFRPSSQVHEQTLALHRLLAPVHGLPIEPREVSQRAFMRDSVAPADVVVFTGAYQNAEVIRPQLDQRQLFLYLGAGINPFVVLPDADLELAARDAAAIRLLNSGQDCLAPDLFLVPAEHLHTFVDLLVGELKGLRYGPYTDPEADYGPIFYDGALEAAALHLSRHRAQIVHGGSVDFRDRHVEPSVLVNPFAEKLPVHEFFTPIFNIVDYPDRAALTRLLTSGAFSERALGATVYGAAGSAEELAGALARRHTVTVNTTLDAVDDGNQPFGGYGPMANYIGRAGRLHVEPILVSKAVADHIGAAQ
jgi:aldehyde dehydrogenase (NAD+)